MSRQPTEFEKRLFDLALKTEQATRINPSTMGYSDPLRLSLYWLLTEARSRDDVDISAMLDEMKETLEPMGTNTYREGVHLIETGGFAGKWRACRDNCGQKLFLGVHDTREEAEYAFERAAPTPFLEQLGKVHFAVIAEEAKKRGKVLVPAQYMELLRNIATTGFWPALYDAEGVYIGGKEDE